MKITCNNNQVDFAVFLALLEQFVFKIVPICVFRNMQIGNMQPSNHPIISFSFFKAEITQITANCPLYYTY